MHAGTDSGSLNLAVFLRVFHFRWIDLSCDARKKRLKSALRVTGLGGSEVGGEAEPAVGVKIQGMLAKQIWLFRTGAGQPNLISFTPPSAPLFFRLGGEFALVIRIPTRQVT